MEDQDKNMFELKDDKAYAGTQVEVWHAVQFCNELEAVPLSELPPGERTCPICTEEYNDPEKENFGCIPVRLPCSHVLGKLCVAIWTTPLGGWKENNTRWEEENNWFERPIVMFTGSANCPLCRREFFEKPTWWESAKGLEARLLLWDRAYEKVGCVRSEKEEQSRADLIRYLEFYRQVHGDAIEKTEAEIDRRWKELKAYHSVALLALYDFVTRQERDHVLTPTQARLQQDLKRIAVCSWRLKVDDPLVDAFMLLYGDEDFDVDLVIEARNSMVSDTEDNGSEESREEEINTLEANSEIENLDNRTEDNNGGGDSRQENNRQEVSNEINIAPEDLDIERSRIEEL